MTRVYLDNAATTPLDKEVLEAMLPFLTETYGNPSSVHWFGRQARAAIEKARKTIAELVSAAPGDIFFTSGGTEADNCALNGAIYDYKIQHVISSRIEHHAVLHTLEKLHHQQKIQLHFVELDQYGSINLEHLKQLLETYPQALVSLMHANNEIANLLPLEEVGAICKHYQALFHSDTVQSTGHYVHDLKHLPLDYMVASAHKFHGPKGIGFLYVHPKSKINAFITGGSQERKMRGGTENVAGIVGLAKALELAYHEMDSHRTHIESLKKSLILQLKENIEGVEFNGLSADLDNSLYTVLNVSLPAIEGSDMLLFNLDIDGIAASGGSACSSGSEVGSHVLAQLPNAKGRTNVRFSFSKLNTQAEINYVAEKLAALYASSEQVEL